MPDESPAPGRSGSANAIGGVFFRSEDPEATRQWYANHLGLEVDAYGTNFSWRSDTNPDQRGHTQWSPFDSDTDYFGNDNQQYMINYRVSDLDAVLAQMQDSGVELVGEMVVESYGRFQHVIDGDGRRIELWEPNDGEYEQITDGVTRS